MGRRRLPLLAAAALLGLVLVAALVLLSRRDQELRGAFEPADATRVAIAARTVVVPISDGTTTRVAVVAAPGVGLTGAGAAPAATTTTVSTPLVGEGTPAPDVVAEEAPTPAVLTDPRGLAAVRVEGTPPRPVAIGRSDNLTEGDELVLADGADTVVVRYVGRASVAMGGSVFQQTLLDVRLPDGAPFRAGPLLDRQGRVVGVIVPERQAGAPPGHAYAVPVEQAADLLRRVGAVNSAP